MFVHLHLCALRAWNVSRGDVWVLSEASQAEFLLKLQAGLEAERTGLRSWLIVKRQMRVLLCEVDMLLRLLARA